MTSLGEHLLDEILTAEQRGKGPLTKTRLQQLLVEIAKKSPEKYPEIVTKLKRLGDEIATLDGVSVGLNDIAPDKVQRDAVLAPFLKEFHTTKDKERVLIDAQGAMLTHTKANTGVMGEMVRSGGRGNAAQLMRTVSAPVMARDEKNQIVPWFIPRSYSEGLKPADAWVAGNEARINAIKSNISVVEPGDLAKILINNMGDKLVTIPDCGTKNGVAMSAHDPHVIDRYLAATAGRFPAGTLVTPQVARSLPADGQLVVRSPMTCEAPHGLCQKCQGLDMTGRPHTLGTNVGMRAAQALAEPLTQFALNAKHGGRVSSARSGAPTAEGIKGVRQLLEIPQSFLHKATLADHDGKVSRVENAPQGGHYVWVDDTRHYVAPDLMVNVKAGQHVEAGDTLSTGVPRPDEIVRHKGLGAGRKYLVDTLHNVYRDAGADIDRRHLETLARSVLNHVHITDPGEAHGFVKGDIVSYNRYATEAATTSRRIPLKDAVGEMLGKAVLHFTAGTRITPSVRDELLRRNVKEVDIAEHAPIVEPFMRPASRTPLLNPDWMARLAHRYLKESLLAGAHRGDVADLHSYSAVPAYAAGTEFGEGAEGRY